MWKILQSSRSQNNLKLLSSKSCIVARSSKNFGTKFVEINQIIAGKKEMENGKKGPQLLSSSTFLKTILQEGDHISKIFSSIFFLLFQAPRKQFRFEIGKTVRADISGRATSKWLKMAGGGNSKCEESTK